MVIEHTQREIIDFVNSGFVSWIILFRPLPYIRIEFDRFFPICVPIYMLCTCVCVQRSKTFRID